MKTRSHPPGQPGRGPRDTWGNSSPELRADAGPQIVTAYNKALEKLGIGI